MSTIKVYAIAWGGKFIGQGQDGVAYLTVTDPEGNIVAGVVNAPINQGTVTGDGSGDTDKIMKSVPWGTPVDKTNAYSYTFSFNPDTPVQLTFTVDVYHNGILMATASQQQMIWPGIVLMGPTSVVVVVPGLLTNVVEPESPLFFYNQQPGALSVNVYMMCGCEIDNEFWPGKNFKVRAVITNEEGQQVASIPLTWSSAATFSGTWTPRALGPHTIQSFVVETTNGNTGCSAPVEAVVVEPEEVVEVDIEVEV